MGNDQTDSLQGKLCVVTGAGRGIGRALAMAFAGAGARVVVTARTSDQIEETAGAIRQAGGTAEAIVCDVSDEGQVIALYDTVGRIGDALDLLVINAGGNFDRARIVESDTADFARTVAVNLTGAYLSLKLAVPLLRAAPNARVMCVGSGMGHHTAGGNAAYACAKAGLWMLVRTAAQELRDDGISINELIPGPVDTDAARSAVRSQSAFAEEWIKEPEDVVPVAMFLATHPGPGPTAQSFSIMRRPR